MNSDYLNFLNLANGINQAYNVRKKILTLAVGYAAACHVTVPSSKVENLQDHFNGNVTVNVRSWIGRFNEVVPLDVTEACETARKFWTMRYNAVHNCPSLDIVDKDFFASLFGAPNHFDPETIAVLNEHNSEIAPVYRAACLIMSKHVIA